MRFSLDQSICAVDLYELLGIGFSTATELADYLVSITGMPFRTAHRIVGRIAADEGSPSMAELDATSREIVGFRASERAFAEADLQRALDPRSNVALRANTGGPAPALAEMGPAETGRMIEERLERIATGEGAAGRSGPPSPSA